jgi:hypothetical protein
MSRKFSRHFFEKKNSAKIFRIEDVSTVSDKLQQLRDDCYGCPKVTVTSLLAENFKLKAGIQALVSVPSTEDVSGGC